MEKEYAAKLVRAKVINRLVYRKGQGDRSTFIGHVHCFVVQCQKCHNRMFKQFEFGPAHSSWNNESDLGG